MGHEDPGPGLVEQRRDGVRHDFAIEGAGVGDHGAEVLVQRFRFARELHPGEEVGPDAQAELVEPPLLVGRGADVPGDGTAARAAATGLVEQVHREAPAQENVLKPLASIRRGFPGLRELPEAVPKHERQLAGVHRHLVERARMVTVKRLAVWTLLDGIERAGIPDHCAADGEAALLLNRQRRG